MHTIFFFCIFIFSGIWRRKITLLRYGDIVPNRARSLSGAEENILWESGQLDCNSSRSLIQTVWWNNCLHFGMRGREEHHSLKMEKFCLETDENGRRYISYTEGLSKTRRDWILNHVWYPPKCTRIKQKDVQWHFSYCLKVNVQLNCNILSPFTLLLLMLL